jgi:hypothetical protein
MSDRERERLEGDAGEDPRQPLPSGVAESFWSGPLGGSFNVRAWERDVEDYFERGRAAARELTGDPGFDRDPGTSLRDAARALGVAQPGPGALTSDYVFSFDRDLPGADDAPPSPRRKVPESGTFFRTLHARLPWDGSLMSERIHRDAAEWMASTARKRLWGRIRAQLDLLDRVAEHAMFVNEMTGRPE